MPPTGQRAWLSAADVMSLFASGAPSKLSQELSRGVDPNQTLEIPQLDFATRIRAPVRGPWPPISELERVAYRTELHKLLHPVRGARAGPGNPNAKPGLDYASNKSAKSVQPGGPKPRPQGQCTAETEMEEPSGNWGWDPSWDDYIPYPAGSGRTEQPRSGAGGPVDTQGPTSQGSNYSDCEEDQWPLVAVACLVGHSPQLLERLLKAGADPNAVHRRTGMTALMCLIQNEVLGPAGKREAVQLLAKHGFTRWGAVRRNVPQDAVLTVILEIVQRQYVLRTCLASQLPAPAPASAAATAGAAAGAQGRNVKGGRGAGGEGADSGAGASLSRPAPPEKIERIQRAIRDSFELLDEILRRRCWPPARGAPPYIIEVLLEQLTASLMLLDSSATRIAEALTGVHAGSTGLGGNSRALHSLLRTTFRVHQQMADKMGPLQVMKPPVLLRRLAAGGLRFDEPVVTAKGLRCLLEPFMMLEPTALAAALGAGMSPEMALNTSLGPEAAPPWGSLLTEIIVEGYPQEALQAVLRAGADPRAPALGCVKPLTLAVLSGNTKAYEALLATGVPKDDAPPPEHPPLPKSQLRMLLHALHNEGAQASEPLLQRHMGVVQHLPLLELFNLLPLLRSRFPADKLHLLALLRCASSKGLREATSQRRRSPRQQQQHSKDEDDEDAGSWWVPQKSIDLGRDVMSVVVDFMQGFPACPYMPYILLLFPYLYKHVMDNPKLTRMTVAPIAALADRVDPHARPSSAARAGSYGAAGPGPAPAERCDWPPEEELPYEVLTAVLELPAWTDWLGNALIDPSNTLRVLQDGDYERCALRIASALLRDHAATAATNASASAAAATPATPGAASEQTAATRPLAQQAGKQRQKGGKDASATPAATSASSVPAPTTAADTPAAARRWRLLALIYGVTLPSLNKNVRPGAREVAELSWLPNGILLTYHDPWIRALVACRHIDVLARATHDAAEAIARAAAASSPSDTSAGETAGVAVPEGETGAVAAADSTATVGAGGAAGPAGVASVESVRAAEEERLARRVEDVMQEAVADLTFGRLCPPTPLTADAWVAGHVAATVAARKEATAVAAAAAAAEGSAGVKAKRAGSAAGGGAGAARQSSSPLLSCYSCGGPLAGVPPWVQASCSLWAWEVLMDLQRVLWEAQSGMPVAKALLRAREALGPPQEP